MTSRVRRTSRFESSFAVLTVSCLAILGVGGLAAARAQAPNDELPPTDELTLTPPNQSGRVQVLVELTDTPAAVVYGAALNDPSVSHAEALAHAIAAGKAQVARILPAQTRVAAAVAALPVHAAEIFRVQKAYNGISYYVDAGGMDALRQLPGIRAVHVVQPEYPSNFTSVPFVGAPQLWGNTLGLPMNITGAGVKIGIIDTGIDYQHPMFGGSGLQADYTANDRVTITPALFPTAKVVGGTDFAGDAYTGANSPVPDPNPTDCNGHGSHVAGTAAGLGVTSAGATYPGPYSPSTPFNSLRIGPGVAPGALLYALRVFGCKGSTGLVVQAIDWAIDPNGDNDFSDHLDVINMSLGSNFGSLSDTSAQASENAAIAGVIVAAASGNAGDTYFITSSPAVSGRSISVAAIVDPGVPGAVLNVNSPPAIAGGYSALPDAFGNGAPSPTGQTANIVLVAAGSGTPSQGCSALTNAAAVAGNIALVDRGTCTFQTKAATAQAAGAIAAIIVNNVPGDPNLVLMGPDNTQPNITIPAVMISFNDGATIKGQLPGVNATLAAATAADTLASFSSRGPRIAGSPVRLKPDIAAPGLNIVSTQTGMTCVTGGGCITPTATGFDPGGLSLTISGTSMATPHIAGTMALLKQLHPDWSVEELKALAMEGALHDTTIGANGSGAKFGPGRVGAGREDVAISAVNLVTAFNADDAGLVSLSFDREVVSSLTQVKTVRLVNHGSTSQTYTLAFDLRNSEPGVTFSLPGGTSVTVPAAQSVTFDVQMSATGSLMNHILDPTVAPGQLDPTFGTGTQPRHFLTEEAGYLTFSQSSTTVMHLPLYSAVRAASAMAGASPIATGGNPTGSTTIALSGTDLCTGTLGAGPVCTGTFPLNEVSLVTPLELQAVHAQNPAIPSAGNVHYAGVAFDAVHNLLLFGVSTWGSWSTPNQVAINIQVDPTNSGTFSRVLVGTSPGELSGAYFGTTATGQDPFFAFRFNTITNGVSALTFLNGTSAAGIDSRVLDNSVVVFTASPAQLGITAGTIFKWKVQTCPGFDPLCFGGTIDTVPGPFAWNTATQGLSFSGSRLLQDLNGATIPVTWSTANMTTNGSLGALLLHHHNAEGTRAQVIPLQGTASADLSVTKSVAPPVPPVNTNATFTITVSNAGPSVATGVVVADKLPAGLTYVSDDGAGAYSSGTGLWTVPGSLAVGGSATLHIVATVTTTDPIDNVASIAASNQLDPNPANDRSQVIVSAPRAADVALTMSVSSPTVVAGNSVTYTLTLKNNGLDPSFSVNVHESFPSFPALTPTSFVASTGVFTPGTGIWNLSSMATGATATLQITVTAPNIAGPLTDSGTASASTSDPNNANNAASATTMVLSPASVTATKTVAGSFVEGGAITYTVVLTNGGTSTQQDNPGDEFTDVLPSQLTLTGASATSGAATTGGSTVHWNGTIAPSGSVTITIHATINAGTALQTVSNQGTAFFDADGNGTNESSALTDDPAVAGKADPTTFKVASPSTIGTHSKTVSGTFADGGHITYTVVIQNSGTSAQLDNPGDEFTDVLPSTLTLTGASATSGTATTGGNTVHWNGSIAAGGSVTITITAVIHTGTAGQTISNQGTIFFDADGNGTNESSVLTDDPSVGGASDPTSFQVASIAQVPTLSTVGLVLLALLLAAGALLTVRRRQA